MFYTIYKTTNLLNGKYYIGKHQTLNQNDDYLGSGKVLLRAINKYGKDSFVKEILFVFDNEADMNAKEKELVVLTEDSYNLCDGGKGGFGYINRMGFNRLTQKGTTPWNKGLTGLSDNQLKHAADRFKSLHAAGHFKYDNFRGKHHSSEWKETHSEYMKQFTGTKNSQYGTCWITNGFSNKKIKKEELDIWVQIGYTRGRKIKSKVS